MDNGAEIYRRFIDGDERAFNEIMSKYRDSLALFIYRFVGDMSAAEDIAIDVFTFIIVHRSHYNFKTSFKTYIFMLGRSRALDYIRHKKTIEIIPLSDTDAESSDDNGISPENAAFDSERRRVLNEAIEKLPEQMRTAVYLVYFEELSYAETGKIIKKSVKQIDNLLYRAKMLLRDELGEEGKTLL